MSWSALGIANAGFGATILAVLLIRNFVYTKELNFKLFLALFLVPVSGLLYSYFNVYYSEDLRQIADFWIIAAPAIWTATFIGFWFVAILKKKREATEISEEKEPRIY
jgi:hypothetical protein